MLSPFSKGRDEGIKVQVTYGHQLVENKTDPVPRAAQAALRVTHKQPQNQRLDAPDVARAAAKRGNG